MLRTVIPILCLLLLGLPLSGNCQERVIEEQQEIIGVLSGQRESLGGIRISNRSSSANRELSRDYLLSLIEAVGVEGQLQPYEMPNLNPLIDLLFGPFQGANVYGVLPSTTSSPDYVLLGAHFDTELNCPGAIDNGSGVALIYSVFKQLSALPYRNKNVIIIFFDQEEEDLIGSQAFAKLCEQGAFQLHSVHTFDAIGWDGDGDRAVELELPTPELEQRYKSVAARLNIPVHVTRVNSTDHHSFRVLGFDAIGLTDEYANGDYAPYKDTPDDTFDTVNFEYLASCTLLVYETIKELIENE